MIIKSKDILIPAILVFITVLAWIGFEAYHSAVAETVPKELNILVQPLSGELKTDTIDKLKER